MTENDDNGGKRCYNVKKKVVYSTMEELLHLDKKELVDRVLRLQAHNEQLQNIIKKRKEISLSCKEDVIGNYDSSSSNGKKRKRNFDFTKCRTRHIFLKFLYLGWDYQGIAIQENTPNTIEEYVFNALIKTCLIEGREMCNFHRCGRTDKGVSAYGQVISLDVRSKFHDNDGIDDNSELPYCKMLNRVLPEDIRVISWCPVVSYCSARFNCTSRSYRYYFIKGQLNIKAMNEAAGYLIGEHDYRNFCKMDVGNGVVDFSKHIRSATVSTFSTCDGYKNGEFDVCVFKITANGFLWRQIRCIMTILLLIGDGKETPNIVKELLDVNKYPRKPQFLPAHCLPLVLHDCQYDFETKWRFNDEESKLLLQQLQKNWAVHQLKSTMIFDMINDISKECGIEKLPDFQTSGLMATDQARLHKPLLEGPFCESLESRIEHFVKKQRIELKESLQEDDNDDDS